MVLRTSVEASIDSFAPGEWEALTRELSLYASRPYLTFAERLFSEPVSYVACRSDSGRLVGALPAYQSSGEGFAPYYDYAAQFAGSADDARGRWLPGMLGGSRTGYLTELIVEPSLDAGARRAVAARLVEAFRALADARDARSAAVLYLVPEAARELRAIPETPELLLSPFAVDADLPLPFASFDDYLRSLSSKRRYAVRRELARFAASGYRVVVQRLSECLDELPPLVVSTMRKHGQSETPEEAGVLLERLVDVLDAQSVVFLCCAPDEQVVGFSLLFAWNGCLYARAVGLDYEALAADSDAYFTLLFYEPISYALERRFGGLHLGVATNAKAARGALIRPFWSLVLPPAGATAPPAAEWNARQRERWWEEYGSFGAQLRDEDWAIAA